MDLHQVDDRTTEASFCNPARIDSVLGVKLGSCYRKKCHKRASCWNSDHNQLENIAEVLANFDDQFMLKSALYKPHDLDKFCSTNKCQQLRFT
eukprot:3695577-Amphidinium_carterae.1